ncbi:MAG: hypothetical protein KL840_07885 [Aquamicrobium sp.]|nr:hypothetical protein [Aquamicrobium sp.]
MARRAFSPHMILHLAVAVVAAPMIVIGLLRLFPNIRAPRRLLLGALAASALEFAVVWGWHAPAMHEAAARWLPLEATRWLCSNRCRSSSAVPGWFGYLSANTGPAFLVQTAA